MGMVVSAAVTGIPIIEELERPNPKKPAGGKQGGKKGTAATVIKDQNVKQSKGKEKENAPPNSRGGGGKESKSLGTKSGTTAQSKGKANAKEEAKGPKNRSNTANSGLKGTNKTEKGQNLSGKGQTRGKR